MTPAELNEIHQKFWKKRATSEEEIWERGYVLRPALEDFQQKLAITSTKDAAEKVYYFRSIPSFNAILKQHDDRLAPFRRAQKKRASQPRLRTRLVRADINNLFEDLASRPGVAKQHWDCFIEGLEALGYQPKRGNTRSGAETCHYILNGKREKIGERQFANRISAIRTKRKKNFG